jgi:hypothetical protein
MLQESSSEKVATLMEDNGKLRAKIRAQQAERGVTSCGVIKRTMKCKKATPSATPARFAFHRTLATACAFWDSFSKRAEGQQSWRKYIRVSKFERIVAWKEITLKGWNGKMHEEIDASQSSEFLLRETARF